MMSYNAPWNWIVPARFGCYRPKSVGLHEMRSKPETFTAYADECDRRADATRDGRLKKLFGDLASQWRELAATTALLEADAKASEDFYNCSSPIRTAVGKQRNT